jgi:signal transduction histidine kinase/tetratricopeptide (TPR) repeat protein
MLLVARMELGHAATPTVFGGRYRVSRTLKRGHGGETLFGVDLASGGAPVVLKTTRASEVSPGTELRLEHEADVLRHLATPSVTPLLDVGREGDDLYLVMPFVRGVTLAERLLRGPLSVDDTIAVALGLFRALRVAHDHGVLHRDIKPANLIVGEGSPPTPVTLIDFGLARSGRLDASTRDLPVGSAAYVSPEQAGLITGEVGERSDLYSAGVVLFECLAGRVPFQGPTVGELLRQHLTARPPELRSLGLPVPRALDDVIQRLLRKDPRDRYQSADSVLSDLEEIAAALARGEREPVLATGARDRRQTVTEPAFVGREAELATFREELARVEAGQSRLMLLEGESGAGKSRLLDEIAVAALRRGVWVLRGRGSERSPPRPLHLFDDVVREIVATARSEPGFAATLRARLGELADGVCAILPALCDVLAPGRMVALGPEDRLEARSLPALIALLDALGSADRPAMVLLDDCHWAGELSLRVVAEWQRAHAPDGRSPHPAHVLVVAAYRPEELSEASPLRRIPSARRLALGPLAGPEVRRLAESMAGPLPAEAVSLVERLSDGNPFLAEAVVAGLTEGGALRATPWGWEVEPQAMAHAQSSRRAGVFLSRRIAGLPAEALRLLSVGAVLGRSFELKLAADLAGQSATAVMDAVAAARRRHLVWIDASAGACLFVHDRIRAALLERLSADERRRLHRLAAVELGRSERAGPSTAFDLAYHFDAAGDPVSALPHAMQAAREARARSALEIAEIFYRIAVRGAAEADSDAATRRDAAEGLGDVLMLRGRYDEAGTQLLEARRLAESAAAQARIEGKLGELAFKRGDVLAAGEALTRALLLLGRRVPVGFAAMLVSALGQALVQLAHTLLPRRLIARRRLANGESDLLAARLYSRLAYAFWFSRGQIATFWAHLSELNLTERYPPTREQAQACSEHGISVTGLPRILFGRGVRYAERGMAIRRALGDVWGQGQSLNFYGILLYAFGHYQEALAKFREAVAVLRRTGDRWEENIAGAHVASCLQRLGALREAVEECRRVYRDGLEIGDSLAMATVLEVWSKATGGAVPPELVEASMRRSSGDVQARVALLQAEGVRLIGAGRPQKAANAFADGEAAAEAARLRSEYVSYLPLWRGHALRLAAIEEQAPMGVPCTERLREAEAALRRGLRLARRHRGHLPMALRERALLGAMRGRSGPRTRRDLDRSLAEARRQGARVEEAATLLARGELGALLGWPGAEEEAALARARLYELGAELTPALAERPVAGAAEPMAVTLSLADRFASIVDEGRRVVSALHRDAIHAAACAASRTLLRGETNMVVACEGDRVHVLASDGEQVELSRVLIESALSAGRPLIESELPSDELTESLLLAGVRSVLCAPIPVGRRTVACLYVAHTGVGGLFGDDEKRIAGYIATLAGAALDKAQAFAELEELSRSLERRVEERTAELRRANRELDANLRRLRETQDQLVQAAKMGAMGTLVAGLSHELNNPIAVILGRAQSALRRMPPDDPHRPGMMAIERQARRCRDLVATLLDFSRKGTRQRELLAVEMLLAEVSALVTARLHHNRVTLEIDAPSSGTPPVAVARTEIESALLNLLDNAIDATPRDGVVLMGAAEETRDGRRGVTLYVRDAGPGIPPEVLPRIFDPFFTTKATGKGTGLGLALSRQFVEGHGGRLFVESTPGKGTTMRIWLPAGVDAMAAEARPT